MNSNARRRGGVNGVDRASSEDCRGMSQPSAGAKGPLYALPLASPEHTEKVIEDGIFRPGHAKLNGALLLTKDDDCW